MAGAPTPYLIQSVWANGASGSYVNRVPQTPPGGALASYQDGFPAITMQPSGSGGLNPQGQDVNGVLQDCTSNILALSAGQALPFNSTLATALGGYAVGAIVPMVSGAGYWINQVGGNTNNPDTTSAASSGWAPLIAYGTTAVSGLTNANVTLTAPQAALPYITFSGTLTGNVQIILPVWIKRWLVVNNTTGSFSLTCKTASGTGVVIAQGSGAWPIYGNGTNIYSEGGIISGIFTPTWSGFSSAPPGNLTYITDGYRAQIYYALSGAPSGTSNATTMTLTGLPAALTPHTTSEALIVPCFVTDNAMSDQPGLAYVSNAGTITFQRVTTNLSTGVIQPAAFTASGIKGLNSIISYPLV